MWVERLDVAGFKQLSGGFNFDPELTLVVGPNEAGKSSLSEAFMRSIWGFERVDRRRRAGISPWERCRPWNGRPWRVVALLVDHDGRRLRAEWDFGDHRVRLLDAITGEDLSERVTSARGDVRLGSELTGVAFTDFRDVCCFDQHTLSQVQHSDSLVNTLQRAVESAHTDVGVADADSRLRDALREHVGARSDTYNLLAGGPLKRERDERDDVRAVIDGAHIEEAQITKLAHELRRRELQRTVLLAERVEVERAIREHEAAGARGVATEALRQATLSAQLPDTRGLVNEEAVSQARTSMGVIERLDSAIVELERRETASAPDVDAERTREAELVAATEKLEQFSGIDRSGEGEVRAGLAQLRQLTAEPAPAVPDAPAPDPTLARYRALRSELLALTGAGPARWNVARLALAAGVAAVSIVVGVAISPAGLAGLAVAGVLAATSRVAAKSAPLAARLRNEFGVDDVEELERRARAEDSVIAAATAEAATARSGAEARRGKLADLAARLGETLDAVAAPEAPLQERATTYIHACEQGLALRERTAALSDVQRRLSELTSPERELATRRDERRATVAELRQSLATLDIDAEDLAAARVELERRLAATRLASEQRAEASGAREALTALLGERTLDDVRADAERAERRLEDHIARHPNVDRADGELAELREQLTSVNGRLTDASRSAAGLQAQIVERENRLPSVPERRERLAALEARIDQRELWLDAIRIAREALAEAARQAHRNFAPHLQRALCRTLPLFTGGRYSDVAVADDLTMSVVAPETGTQVPADCLSLATQDQIYLVQRLEIAKMLIPASGPVPLLLDEPFAEFDEDREKAAIELLCQEAESRQIILFTKDPGLVDRVAAVRGAPHVIELDGPLSRMIEA